MINQATTLAELEQIEPMYRLVLERYELPEGSDNDDLSNLLMGRVKDPLFVIRLLNLYADHRTFRLADYSDHSIAAILDYLQKTHTFYEQRFLPKMDMCIAGVKRNFPGHPIAEVLDTFFRTYRNELLEHIELEEKKLFPYASSLYDGKFDVSYSVKEFKLQHDHHVEDELGTMLKLVEEGYPDIAKSMSFRAFRSLLEKFEKDLFIHHIIEERVFVARIHEMELNTHHKGAATLPKQL